MGDFVGKEEVDRIRAHYRAYMADGALEKGDNRATPVSGAFDASTFREVSSWYVNRLLRYIETQEMIDELLKEDRAAILRECLDVIPQDICTHDGCKDYSNDGLGRRCPEPGSDDEVRAIFVRLITFVAAAKVSHDAKNDALQCIEVLQARLLP